MSPRKRPRDKHHTEKVVVVPGQAAEHQKLMERFQALLASEGGNTVIANAQLQVEIAPSFDSSIEANHDENITFNDDLDFSPHLETDDMEPGPCPDVVEAEVRPTKRTRHTNPDATMERQYQYWRFLLPTLVAAYSSYHACTLGKPLDPLPSTLTLCTRPACIHKTTNITCLLFDRKYFDSC
jgi:hypothetical protein